MQKCVIDPSGYAWHTETVACLTPKGKRINPENSVTEGTWTYKCIKKADGNIGMSMASAGSAGGGGGKTTSTKPRTTCLSEGKVRKDGDTWTSKSGEFIKKCTVGETRWQVVITHCILPNGTKIPVNTTKNDGTYTWDCKMKGNMAILNPTLN